MTKQQEERQERQERHMKDITKRTSELKLRKRGVVLAVSESDQQEVKALDHWIVFEKVLSSRDVALATNSLPDQAFAAGADFQGVFEYF